MPTEILPLVNAQQSGDEELGGAMPLALNVTIDGAGAVRRRPGIGLYFETPFVPQGPDGPVPWPEGPTDGIHVTEGGTLYFTVRRTGNEHGIFILKPGPYFEIGTLFGPGRPVFLETEARLVMAAGSTIKEAQVDTVFVQDLGDTPPKASHVVHSALRLIANDVEIDPTKMRYSNPASGTVNTDGHEQWTPGMIGGPNFITTEADPDPVIAIHTTTGEVWAFGTKTLEIFTKDLAYVFVPVSAIETGCIAPYSVIKREGLFYFLDHARRFISSDGRNVHVLSAGIHKTLQDFRTVDDCYGYRVLLGPVDALVWTFPTEGVSLCYQVGGGWSQWTSFSPQTNQHGVFSVQALFYDRLKARNIVAAPGVSLGVLERRPTDLVSNPDPAAGVGATAVPIVSEIVSGFVSRGTDARKRCRSVRLTFRRGAQGPYKPELRGLLSYRDSLGPWQPYLPLVLDGEEPVVELTNLGVYRRRQWRYTFSDDADDIVLSGAEETYEVI